MRLPSIAVLALGLTGGLVATPQAVAQSLFISPMGEPFRGEADGAPEQEWFKGADKNADGLLTEIEMVDDANRFFGRLDINGDGEIDPPENDRYEGQLVPEVSMGLGLSGSGEADLAFNGGPRLERQERYRSDSVVTRYSYIAISQPIMAADTNFNRGVSRAEFERAARSRFRLLDTNADGKLEQSELPELRRKKSRKR